MVPINDAGARAATLVMLVLALGGTCVHSARASLTFQGSTGDSTTGRVVAGWTVAGVSDSLVDTFHMTPDSLYAGVDLFAGVGLDSVFQGSPVPVRVGAWSHLFLAPAGSADSTGAVASGELYVEEQGTDHPPGRWARATFDVALRYQSDAPTIYWGVVFTPQFGDLIPPGPPGHLQLTHPAADSSEWKLWGSAPNTGVLPDIGAVLETFLNEGQFGIWAGYWSFSVFIDNSSFVPYVAGVTDGPQPSLALLAPRPNPSQAGSTIEYALPAPSRARLEIFDAAGRRVRSLVDGVMPAGTRSARWDGTDERGSAVDAGVYFARLAVGRGVLVKRLVMLR